MADNVDITSGVGTTVATDQVGSAHFQKIKIADGAADSSAMIGGDATNGLDVDVTRVSGTVTVANGGTFAVQAVCTNAGTFAVQAAQSGTWNITNVSGTISLPTGAATAAKQPAIGTAGTASTDVITVQGIASMTALKVDGSAATQPVSGTVTADTELPAAAALADGAANPTTPTAGSATLVYNGTTWDRLKGDTTNGAYVNVKAVPTDPFGANADAASATGSISAKLRFIAATGIPITGTVTVGSHAVTNAGTFAVQAACAGDVAHDGADSGNPIKTGGRAMTTARTAVADGDRADHAVDVQGRTIVERDGPRELDVMQSTTITSSTSETTVGTAVASTFLDVIDCIVCNSSATATLVTFKDSTAGTTRFVLYVPAGATVGFSGQRWPQATVNNNWTATCGTSVASVYVSLRMRKTK